MTRMLAANEDAYQELKAYLIAEIEVVDAAVYEDYKTEAAPIVAKYGGRYIVRGGPLTLVEGDSSKGRVVVIEFPNTTAAYAFVKSDEYRPVAEIRNAAAKSRIMIVEGIIP